MAGASETFQNKTLEEEANKMKQGLVQLKQMYNTEKQQATQLKSELETLKTNYNKISAKFSKVSDELDQKTSLIADLHEQVDANADAAEVVEKLTERCILLESKLAEEVQKCEDYEGMNDMNDELLEANKNLELELREEVELGMAERDRLVQDNEALKVQKIDYWVRGVILFF